MSSMSYSPLSSTETTSSFSSSLSFSTTDDDIQNILSNLNVRQLDKINVDCIPYLIQKCRIMILFLSFMGILFIYSAFLSKYIPDTGMIVLDFLKYDYYFCYLIPLMILPTMIVVYLKWLSMCLFQHIQN